MIPIPLLLRFMLAPMTATHAQSPALDALPTLQNYESHRITSADPSGGNADWRDLAPGATLEELRQADWVSPDFAGVDFEKIEGAFQ